MSRVVASRGASRDGPFTPGTDTATDFRSPSYTTPRDSAAYRQPMGLGRGKTEHAGPRDMSRTHGHWGFTDEAKQWASRARRRAEVAELRGERAEDSDADR